jgi:hypothetical protein
MMIPKADVDLSDHVDFIRVNGAHAAWISGASFLSIAVLGFAAVVTESSVAAEDEVPKTFARPEPLASTSTEPEVSEILAAWRPQCGAAIFTVIPSSA